nr:hypothetical protein BJQ95_01087 [Cryobacterium sp. SO1]
MVPPCASAIDRAMARPRPVLRVPPEPWALEASPRANRSKTTASRASVMPGPSSCTLSCRGMPGAPTRSRVDTVLAGGVCTRALESRFATSWCSRSRSPRTTTALSGTSASQVCSGAETLASFTAVSSRSARSTSSTCRSWPSSRRASSSRSLTNELILLASDSMRASEYSVISGSSALSWRVSSAYPWMAASGVRNSWEASVTNRRIRRSVAARTLSAVSTWSSSWLRASPTMPASVRGSVSAAATRVEMPWSPTSSGSAVTSTAVSTTRASGRSARRTTRIVPTTVPASASTAKIAMPRPWRSSAISAASSGTPATSSSPSLTTVATR